jgi:hypothetical protein
MHASNVFSPTQMKNPVEAGDAGVREGGKAAHDEEV